MTIVALIALSWVLLAAALSYWLAEGRWRRPPHPVPGSSIEGRRI